MFRRSQRYALYQTLRSLPDPYRLERIVDLRLVDRLSALHAADQRIDLVALLAKGQVVLVPGARFALRRLRGLLQFRNRLGVDLSGVGPGNSDRSGKCR